MIEIALSLTTFLLLTVGVMEFGLAVYSYNFCNYASGEAARWASVRGSQYVAEGNAAITQQDVQNYVLGLAVGFSPSNFNVSLSMPDTNPGAVVGVTVAYTVVPLAGLALKQNIQISSTSQKVIVH
ncbi:MAG TPA: TadE/TadG family type IV pilus assembly protein [Bryobacteraceae bacterium]|nr:TadE/TadG family type IV pilus assembly protein [Bryobacteraceae bacterium]